ncbi:MAG: hypothetical protein ACI8UO_000585 [Verrucomicrobiales bacterium]|jgi:hypothetical protein
MTIGEKLIFWPVQFVSDFGFYLLFGLIGFFISIVLWIVSITIQFSGKRKFVTLTIIPVISLAFFVADDSLDFGNTSYNFIPLYFLFGVSTAGLNLFSRRWPLHPAFLVPLVQALSFWMVYIGAKIVASV